MCDLAAGTSRAASPGDPFRICAPRVERAVVRDADLDRPPVAGEPVADGVELRLVDPVGAARDRPGRRVVGVLVRRAVAAGGQPLEARVDHLLIGVVVEHDRQQVGVEVVDDLVPADGVGLGRRRAADGHVRALEAHHPPEEAGHKASALTRPGHEDLDRVITRRTRRADLQRRGGSSRVEVARPHHRRWRCRSC